MSRPVPSRYFCSLSVFFFISSRPVASHLESREYRRLRLLLRGARAPHVRRPLVIPSRRVASRLASRAASSGLSSRLVSSASPRNFDFASSAFRVRRDGERTRLDARAITLRLCCNVMYYNFYGRRARTAAYCRCADVSSLESRVA